MLEKANKKIKDSGRQRRKKKQVDIDIFEIVGWVSLPRYTKGNVNKKSKP